MATGIQRGKTKEGTEGADSFSLCKTTGSAVGYSYHRTLNPTATENGGTSFLFEYREQEIQLQYSKQFVLPTNLRFIATMNTADRSIRGIDAALRRRFEVFEIHPNEEVLNKHYANGATSKVPDLVDGFLALNAALESKLDRHHRIGHTFFMRGSLDGKAMSQIWSRKIYPLIEEYFFDQEDLAKEFSLERFWPSVGNAT